MEVRIEKKENWRGNKNTRWLPVDTATGKPLALRGWRSKKALIEYVNADPNVTIKES